MQITLCEDNSLFHNGVPTLVVLVVKFDDGNQKRIPYPAGKTISELYQDLASIAPKVSNDAPVFIPGMDLEQSAEFVNKFSSKPLPVTIQALEPKPLIDKSNTIEKEDIVTLTMLDPGRNKDATCNLIVGQELRVISVVSTGVTLPGSDEITKIVQGYDVVNDKGDRLERTRVFPQEVALLRKRTSPVIAKNNVVSEILNCPSCNAPNALGLDGDTYKGTCTDCKSDIAITRIIKKCQTAQCGRDVSCFDIGGKYQGKCNQCQATIEVPYA